MRAPAIGQHWSHRKINGFNGELLATERDEIVALDPDVTVHRHSDARAAVQEERQRPWGQVLRDLSWDSVQTYEQAIPLWPASLAVGARSTHHTHYRLDGFSYRYWIQVLSIARGWEKVELDQGIHLALRVEKFIRLEHPEFSRIETTRHDTLWLAPALGRWVAREVWGEYLEPDDKGSYRGLEAHHRWELTEWA